MISFSRIRFSTLFLTASILAMNSLMFPPLSIASAGESAKFFVAAWLVRIWLALVSGTAIIIGVMVASDSYSASSTMHPQLTRDSKVVMTKQYRLSYRKIGGGLLCAIVGCALFVTSVFLLPDLRTGHSGMGKIVAHFTTHAETPSAESQSGNSMPAKTSH
jgi:hypothetical protein